jgi:hypothetical protein
MKINNKFLQSILDAMEEDEELTSLTVAERIGETTVVANPEVREAIWMLIDKGKIELTSGRKIKKIV